MSKAIRVILLENIDSLGKSGEVVSVSEGYARNFLFPQGKAALATEPVERGVAQQRSREKAAADQVLAGWQQKAESLTGTELALTARRKEGDEIFGSVTAAQIVKELNKQAGLSLKAKDLDLAKPITKMGSQDVTIYLSSEVETTIRVTVAPDPASEPKEEDE